MAWKSLRDSLDRKPLVLAGPILRKVTTHRVTVWIATRAPASVTLTVANDEGVVVMTGTLETVAIGVNLHIAAVTARLIEGKPKLTEGVVYQYHLAFDLINGGSMELEAATGGAGVAKLAYPPFTRPSFALPPADLNSLRVLQGSCRMPHAEGKDTMPLIDGLIAATATNAYARPHQLLLTGDQIYADDVSDALLMVLIDAADVLFGWQEVIPGVVGGTKFRTPIPACLRAAVLGNPGLQKLFDTPGFSSEDLQSHLMSLGEYLAMYLFVWSEVLWPPVLPSRDEVAAEVYKRVSPEEVAASMKFSPLGAVQSKKINLDRDRMEKHSKSVHEFRQTLGDVRCALANIPTYMIFDDHEVTDDWNMTRDFCSQVYRNELGLRIVQNALAAYALCQHWGNAPDQFEPSKPGRKLLDLFDPPQSRPPGMPKVFPAATAAANYDRNSTTMRRLLAVHDDQTLTGRTANALFHDAGSLDYHFSLECDGHEIIFTDTRTWRAFPKGGSEPSELLPKSQLYDQILGTTLGNRMLMVVLSTNAPAVQPIRAAARHAGLARYFEHFPDVYESWEIPSESFDRLLTVLTDKLPKDSTGELRGQVLLLSGDVHHSFATRVIYRAKTRYGDVVPQPATAVVAQLVASSFKKETGSTRRFQDDGYTAAPTVAKLLPFIPPHRPEGYVGWNVLPGTKLDIGRDIRVDAFVGTRGKINFKAPTHALWTENGFPYIVQLTRVPDYRYRLDYLTPLRQERQRARQIKPLPVGADLEKRKEAAKSYNDAHAQYRRNSRQPGEEKLIGVNNFGEITFEWGSVKAVRHTLRWHRKSSIIATTYRISLDPNDPDFKDIPDGTNS